MQCYKINIVQAFGFSTFDKSVIKQQVGVRQENTFLIDNIFAEIRAKFCVICSVYFDRYRQLVLRC